MDYSLCGGGLSFSSFEESGVFLLWLLADDHCWFFEVLHLSAGKLHNMVLSCLEIKIQWIRPRFRMLPPVVHGHPFVFETVDLSQARRAISCGSILAQLQPW